MASATALSSNNPSPRPGYATSLGGFFENDPMLGVIEHLGLHGTVLKLCQILPRAARRDDPVHRDQRGDDRDLAPVLVAVRAPPAAELFSRLHASYRTPWFTLIFFSMLAAP